MDAIERLIIENHRLRAERDRLFGLVVANEQLDETGRGFSRTKAIARALDWMATLHPLNPIGEIARALTEHDRYWANLTA